MTGNKSTENETMKTYKKAMIWLIQFKFQQIERVKLDWNVSNNFYIQSVFLASVYRNCDKSDFLSL